MTAWGSLRDAVHRSSAPATPCGCGRCAGTRWNLDFRTDICDLDGAHERRHSLRVRVFQVREFVCAEPAKVIVFFRRGVCRFSDPVRDEERVHPDVGVINRHRDGTCLINLDAEFFGALPADGVAR